MEDFNIDIQQTKNENIVKFIANSFITKAESFEFKNIDEAKNSPLAQQLFYLPFVKTVFISQNFIAIEKYKIVEWRDVQEEVAASIKAYLESGKPVIISESSKKIPVTVYAESTPNPSVLKFVANKPLTESTFEFKNIDETTNAPIANALFHFPFVKEVFIHSNYISITKYNSISWDDITLELREFLKKYLEEGKTLFKDDILQKNTNKNSKTDETSDKVNYTDIEKEIITILNEYVQPAVASDGGHIAFESYNEATKTVRVVLQGACSGCPSSTFTLKNGIETMLKEMLNDANLQVEAHNG